VRGHFAVGIGWGDSNGFLAVDRFAARTLCYRVDDGHLRFAERADELTQGHAQLDLQAIFDYLFFHVIPSPRTIFKGVHRVPPGHSVQVEHGEAKVSCYWKPRFRPEPSPSFPALKEEFRSLLRVSAERHVGQGKVASFLSGGTDSSTLAGLLNQVTGQPTATYAIGFNAQGYDEMEYARIAARHFGCEHHERYVTPDDLVRGIPALAASFDQPFGNSSALPAYYCAAQAKGDGVTCLLGGDGGDELFGGNSRYVTQRIFDHYHRLPSALRNGLVEPFFRMPAVASMPLLRKGSGYVRHATTPMPDRLEAFNLVRRLGYGQVFTADFLSQIDTNNVHRHEREAWAAADARDELDRHLAYDWRYTLAESDLPKVRGATALAGVDTGFPFLDDDLVAFSMRLPVQYKVKGRQLRWFFKEALRGFLPDEIIAKKKQGFGLPFGVWMVRHEPLHRLAADSLRDFGTRGVVQPAFIDRLLNVHLPEHPHYYGTLVWVLMMLEQWLRAHAPLFRAR
jgi:asparagine synthase (glutamine-hydrolysing)